MPTRTLASLIAEFGGLLQTGPFGSQLHQHDYTDEGVPVVMPKDIIAGRVNECSVARIPEAKARQLSRHMLKFGDIVFPRRGDIGRCALIGKDEEGFLCGTGCIKIELPKEIYSPRFLYYYLGLRNVVEWLERNAIGTTMLNLNTSILGGVQIPDVDLAFQEHIVGVLGTYDDLIENNRRRVQLLEQAARLLYKEWFVHLRFPGYEHVKIKAGVPEGWEKTTAFDIMEVLSGGTPKTDVPNYWDGEIPFFTPKDAVDYAYAFDTEKKITEEGLRNCNSRLYPKDTVFITARGTVGKINLAQTAMAMNQSCYALVAKPPLNQYYLYFALVEGVEEFRSRAVGAVFDAIIRDTFKLIPFVVPDEKLIRMFTDHVSPILNQIDVLASQTRKLAEARDLLLPRLMNGEIVI
ncbi:MAG: restriction endonuclease subunit S [Bacillota bacterium]